MNNICYICGSNAKESQKFYDTCYINCTNCGEYKIELSIDFKLYKKDEIFEILKNKKLLGENIPKIKLEELIRDKK